MTEFTWDLNSYLYSRLSFLSWRIIKYLLKLVSESGNLKYFSVSVDLYTGDRLENLSFNFSKFLSIEHFNWNQLTNL